MESGKSASACSGACVRRIPDYFQHSDGWRQGTHGLSLMPRFASTPGESHASAPTTSAASDSHIDVRSRRPAKTVRSRCTSCSHSPEYLRDDHLGDAYDTVAHEREIGEGGPVKDARSVPTDVLI